MTALTTPDRPDTSMVPTAELPWAELFDGFELQLLRAGEGSGRYTVLTRMRAGIEIPTHHHHGEVHAWTISGTWGYREYPWQATVADYIYEEAGSTHTLFVPADMAEPAVVLFVIDGAQDYLDDTGEVFFTQTAEVVSDLYTQALQDRGIPVPASILP